MNGTLQRSHLKALHCSTCYRHRGFTIAEIAIVFVILGLILSLILVGDGIIVQSRIKSLANEIESIKGAVLLYSDRYRAVPGDDPRAGGRWTAFGAIAGGGNGALSGSYQDVPPTNPATLVVNDTQGESLNFWWHLRLAQLVITPPSSITVVAQPLNFYAGVTGAQWAPLGFPRLAVCTANVPGTVAIGIENQIDDGSPQTGLVHAKKQTASNEPIAPTDTSASPPYTAGETDMYILCRRID